MKDEPTDEDFLRAVDEVCRIRWGGEGIGANRWDLAAFLAGYPEAVGEFTTEYPNMPQEVVLSKARELMRRGLLNGCLDGCRGDFTLTQKGRGTLT